MATQTKPLARVVYHDGTHEDFEVHAGTDIICQPGKFESCCTYVPYYWRIGLEGFADRDNSSVWGFDVRKEDKDQFPSLKRRGTVKLVEDSQGFVSEV